MDDSTIVTALEKRIETLATELNSIKLELRISQSTERHAVELYSELEVEHKAKMHALDVRERQISDLYRKNGILEVNDLLEPMTQAEIESRAFANASIETLVAWAELHTAHAKVIGNFLRKKHSELEIEGVRAERAAKRRKIAENDLTLHDPIRRKEIKKENEEKKLDEKVASGIIYSKDKKEHKAIKGLAGVFGADQAKLMLELMKASTKK